jgi:nucleoid DNA-binding protein/nucleoid-associated protein YgaU
MNNRLTIKELAVELAKSAGKDYESVEKFLNELITVISEKIFTDRLIQVKGIGTFKIIQVEKRESVDVNTKERIVIPEHYKLTFSPEKDLKETVNKPFSFFESIEINDDSEFPPFETELEKEKNIDEDEDGDDGVDSENESDTVREIGLMPEPQPQPVFVERIKPEITNELKEHIIEPVAVKPVIDKINEEVKREEEQKEKVAPEAIPVTNVMPEKTDEPKPVIEEIQEKAEQVIVQTDEAEPAVSPVKRIDEEVKAEIEIEKPEQEEIYSLKELNHLNENSMDEYSESKRKRDSYSNREREHNSEGNNSTLVILLLVLVVILIIALGSIVFMSRDVLFKGSSTGVVKNEAATTNSHNQFTLPDDDTNSDSMADDWGIENDEFGGTEESENETANSAANTTTDSNIIANVQIKRGDRLNLIALEYYGNKLFWVYIYEQNKSKITNPNSIPVGLSLEIPAKSVYNIDANDPASIRRASILQTQILSKYPSRNSYRNPYNQYNNSYNQYNNPYNQNQYNDPYQQYNDPYQNQYQNQNQYQQTPNYY